MPTSTLALTNTRSTSVNFAESILKWESVLFAVICIADMITTLYMIHHGVATEANPMLAPFLQYGDATFCIVKLISFVPMLCIAAWYRLQNPKFIEISLRFGLAAYVVIYLFGTCRQFIG